MRKVSIKLITIVFLMVIGILYSSKSNAQQWKFGIAIKVGNWEANGPHKGCVCGKQPYDCFCGQDAPFSPPYGGHIPSDYTLLHLLVPVISGNTIELTIDDRITLKSDEFDLKESFNLDPKAAESIGYESVKVLPGKYKIIDGKKMIMNVQIIRRMKPMMER